MVPDFIEKPDLKDENCPRCGMLNTMVMIPKHRNGVYGRKCGRCGEINYTKSVRWEKTAGGNMSYEEYKGMK